MISRRICFLNALIGTILAVSASSQSMSASISTLYCSSPRKPSCVNAYGTFDESFSFEICRSYMERFLRDVDRYAECINDQAQQAIDEIVEEAQREIAEAREEADEAVELFNCKAQGNSICY